MELERTHLGNEAKNILGNLISFTEENAPSMLAGLKTITENEFCLNISEVVKNNFGFSQVQADQGIEKKMNNKSSIRLN